MRFHFLALLFFALDVDAPAQQLRGQTHVLPLLADGERELRVVDHHFHVLAGAVDHGYARDLRGAQRVRREDHGIVAKFDNVDLLAAQLTNDRLHAHALHAHAGADAVDVTVAARYGDLSALAGFARAALDDHGVVVDLGNFLFEQAHDQLWRGARNNHAGVFAGLVDALDNRRDAVAHAEAFKLRLFFFEQTRFGLAHADNQIRTFDALHFAAHQFADTPGVFRKHVVALGFADFLQDHLLGGLRRNAAQRVGRLGKTNFRIDFRVGANLLRVFERDFLIRIGDFSHHFLHAVDQDRAGGFVQIRRQLFIGVKMLARRHQHGVLHGVQNDLRVDPFFLA